MELEADCVALSTHGTNGRTELRDRIVASYATLLAAHHYWRFLIRRSIRPGHRHSCLPEASGSSDTSIVKSRRG